MKTKQTQHPREETRVIDAFMAQEQQPLEEKLAAQIQRTPWWMISMAAHILLLVLLALVVYDNYPTPKDDIIYISMSEDQASVSTPAIRPPSDEPDSDTASRQEKDVAFEEPNQPAMNIDYDTTNVDLGLETSSSNNPLPQANTTLDLSKADSGSFASDAIKGLGNKMIGSSGSPTGMIIGKMPLHPRRKQGARAADETEKTRQAVRAGLQWLAEHQNSDGSWDPNPGTNGQHKVAITAMALLAFFGDGHGERGSKYGVNVRKGVDWLLNDVDSATGKFNSAGVLYEQGLGTMALNEAYGMLIRRARDKARQATRYIIAAQTGRGGWNYNPGGANGDTSVTGFQVQALKLAKEVKLGMDSEVDASLQKARAWVEFANDKQGNTGYNGPAKGSIALTAAGAWMRIYTDSSKSDEQLRLAVNNISQQPPSWNVGASNKQVNMYYCYYGTLVSFQWGGAPWKQWNNAMSEYVVNSQSKAGDDTRGSWASAGLWAENWGRAGQTALSVLCLEVYYRYPRFLK